MKEDCVRAFVSGCVCPVFRKKRYISYIPFLLYFLYSLSTVILTSCWDACAFRFQEGTVYLWHNNDSTAHATNPNSNTKRNSSLYTFCIIKDP